MERNIKNLSIANIILTSLFFLSMFGAANVEGTNTPQFIESTLVMGVNVLFFVVPISYMVVFAIGMTSMFKKIMNSQNRIVQKKIDKFPMLWFALSSFSFIGYFIFVNLIVNSL